MSDYTLPTNIKQIGSIDDSLRIYVEDYVCTYLFQYAEAGEFEERVALLVGRYMVIDGQAVLFINGAIQGKYTEEKNGLLIFTEKSGAYASAMIEEFFEGMEIVGWMLSQPSYGLYLNQHYAGYHLREFTRQYQVMFVMDAKERINTFYTYNPEGNALRESKGYFIYYDKNRNMHEYMLKNKAVESDYKTQLPEYIELTRVEREETPEESFYPKEDKPSETPEALIRRRQAERSGKRRMTEQKRTLNLLVSLSAVLFIICFVMGAGLIQNQDRIARMESELVQLSTAYKNLFVQNNAASVFAADFEATPDSVLPTEEQQGVVIQENVATPAPTPVPTLTPTPTPTPTPTQTPTPITSVRTIPETYTVQAGDSLSGISIQFYGSSDKVPDILALNGKANPNYIMAGETILLP